MFGKDWYPIVGNSYPYMCRHGLVYNIRKKGPYLCLRKDANYNRYVDITRDISLLDIEANRQKIDNNTIFFQRIIYPDGSGKWKTCIRYDYMTFSVGTFNSIKEAQQDYNDMISELDRPEYIREP